MLEIEFIREQVNKMFEEKGYDQRAKTALTAFFTNLADRYNLTKEQFTAILENYKSKISQIGFYDVGSTNYKLTLDAELIFDKGTAESLDETNIDRFLETITKANAQILFSEGSAMCKELIDLSAVESLIRPSQEINSDILSMVASSFDIDKKDVLFLYQNIWRQVTQHHSTQNDYLYEFSNDARMVLSSISDQLKIIQEDPDRAKDVFKAIYSLCLLNFKLKVKDHDLATDKSSASYVELLKFLEKYKEKFNIDSSELDSVTIEGSWKVKTNDILSELQERFKDIPVQSIESSQTTEDDKFVSRVDKKEMIEEQKSYIKRKIPTISEIEDKVNGLIQEKAYPKEFHYVLMEFFRRNAVDFKWDIETLDKKIQNLAQTIDSFEYVPKADMDGASASVNLADNCINISSSTIFSNNFEFITTIMHELEHAISHTNRGRTDIEKPFSNHNIHLIKISGLDELITEGTTIKTEGKNPYSDKYATTYKYRSGYSEFTGALSMISASLGISESDFLIIANNGSDKAIDVLESKYPGIDIASKFNIITDELTHINDGAIIPEYAAKSFSKIYNTLTELYNQRIEIDKQKPDFDSTRARYDEYKLNRNLLAAKRYLRLSSRVLSKEIPNYASVTSKARIRPEERTSFEEIGQSITQEIAIRDNTQLKQAAVGIKSYKKNFDLKNPLFEKIKSKFNSFRRKLLSPHEEPPALIPPRGPIRDEDENNPNPWKVDVDMSQISQGGQPTAPSKGQELYDKDISDDEQK